MRRPDLIVQKFGGTSLATADRRAQVVAHVREAQTAGRQVVVVASAMGRRGDPYATDTLLDLLRTDEGAVDPRDYDLMFTCGEAISVALLSHTLRRAGLEAAGLTSVQARIFTNGRPVEAEITEVDTSRLRTLLASGAIPVVTGGQGVAPQSLDYTTLGRGGSDTSAVAVGVALGASRVDIFTDVDGVAVVDPRIVPGARLHRQISYGAMYEMARFGAKVVHPRALLAGWKGRTPIAVRSTFSSNPGTLIADVDDEAPIVGLALLPPMDTVTLPAGSIDDARREQWERVRLVLSITDSRSGALLVGAAADKAADLSDALAEAGVDPLHRHGLCCWLSVVGAAAGLREVLPRHTTLLARHGVMVMGCEVGERRCTFVVPDAARDQAARLLHDSVWI